MRRGETGFTLLETIVSLTILLGIAASLVLAFRLAGASIERGEQEAREMARLRAGIAVLERSIRSADGAPLPSDDSSRPYFVGEPGKLRFLSSSGSSAAAGGGFRLLCFFEAQEPSGRTGFSVSDAAPFRPDGTGSWDGMENPRVFLPGATGVTFRYSPGPSEDGTWEWFDAWDGVERGGLPRAVRVEFTMPSEGGPRKNAFVVPVMAGGAG